MATVLTELRPLHYHERRCVDCHKVYSRSYGHYNDKRCYGCLYDFKERTVNPIQMGNRHNHQWTGEDRVGRFRVSDQDNLLTAREAKSVGLTCKRDGRLSRYYDVAGTLVVAYSYNTCVYAQVFDAAENVMRDVFNFTPYSQKTNEHIHTLTYEILGIGHWQWLNGGDLSLRTRRVIELVRVPADTDQRELCRLAQSALPSEEVAS
jgi:hypothetical protein